MPEGERTVRPATDLIQAKNLVAVSADQKRLGSTTEGGPRPNQRVQERFGVAPHHRHCKGLTSLAQDRRHSGQLNNAIGG